MKFCILLTKDYWEALWPVFLIFVQKLWILSALYTVLHMFRQLLFLAGNQGNHQNFNPSLLSKKLWLILMGMKQFFFFFEKKYSKWPTQKNLDFQTTNSQYFFVKISGIGPLVSRINWCEGHWCGSTYMVIRLSNVNSETGLKSIFCVFRLFLSLTTI